MEFDGQYLTYEEYRGLGGILDLTPFNILEFEARRKVDIRTQNRLKNNEKDIPQEVKLCIYNLIESINAFIESERKISSNGNISSVSTDGYSESYITPIQIKEIVSSKSKEIDDIIRTYLLEVNYNGQHLLFAGRDNVSKQ